MKAIYIFLICVILLMSSCSISSNESNDSVLENDKTHIDVNTNMYSSNYNNDDDKQENEPVLNGELTSFDNLNEFVCDEGMIAKYSQYFTNDFPNNDRDEIISLYGKGSYLISLFGTDNLLSPQIDNNSYVDLGDKNGDGINELYYSTKINYYSFYKHFLDAFTEEMIKQLYNNYPFFYSYNDELWVIPTIMTGDLSVVHKEYEFIENSESICRFKCKKYHVKEGETPIFNRNDISEYVVDYDYFTFIKTDNGWRISECPCNIW